MDNATFEALDPKAKLEEVARIMVAVLGPEQALQHARTIAPIVKNLFGHGSATTQPGDDPDPSKNFWGGAWQIYRAE